ncbi:hypothetical protein [Labrys monachus]|uniref:Uncharacterized protein n=1 Tax=Labrys monachus TaxID=217067 RepID=A0ABU0FL89_9HYPH|nr:hypothetical protein [Labrys monachus]MDQ0395377.1 hypothetical protein [Labrys monachus]
MNATIWIHYARPRPHWYGLGPEQQAEHKAAWREVAQASAAKGAEPLGAYHVRGQHDYETVEVWRFPSPEAAFEHWAGLTARAYGEWFAFANNVGLSAEVLP